MQSEDNQQPGANEVTLVAPRSQQGSARLILRRADGQLKEYGLDKDEITIGRLASNDVALPDDRSVSRRHAVIRRSNVGYVIEDQQSNNGTYVDGEKILYPFVLHNGQSIKIGANELTFTVISAQIKAASQPEQAMPPAAAPSPGIQPGSMAAPRQPSGQIPSRTDYDAVPPPPQTTPQPIEATPVPAFPPPPQPEPVFPAQPAPAFQSPAFPQQPESAFQPPQPTPGFQPDPAFQLPQPVPAFQPPPQPVPAFQQPGPFAPPPAPNIPAYPAPAAQTPSGPGMIICQNCGQSTMANKAFCLNCGTSLAAQSTPAAPAGANPFGAQQPGFFQTNQGGPLPGAAFGQPPVNNPQAWPPPQPGPQPWPPQPQPAQQPWPPQPGPFGAPAPAPGPLDAVVLYSRTMRLMQPSDLRVRLTTQFVAPGMLQPGTVITVRVWPGVQDAFFLSSQWISLRVPGPGGVEEGAIQATPRPAAPGVPYQLFFLVSDASGQPLQPNPAVADIAITDQPASPFEGQSTLRLPI